MLLDDDSFVLSALHRTMRPFLDEHNIEIDVFSDPELAMLRCAQVSFDIVMSHCMPGLSGAAFLQIVKEIQPDAVLIMLRASGEFADVADARDSGEVFCYMSKPWESEAMQAIFLRAFALHDDALQARLDTRAMWARYMVGARPKTEVPEDASGRRESGGAMRWQRRAGEA